VHKNQNTTTGDAVFWTLEKLMDLNADRNHPEKLFPASMPILFKNFTKLYNFVSNLADWQMDKPSKRIRQNITSFMAVIIRRQN